jgi:hypothetical protein
MLANAGKAKLSNFSCLNGGLKDMILKINRPKSSNKIK